MTLLIISDNIILKYEFYKLYIISRELTSNKQFLATIWPTWREYLFSVMWWRAWSLYSAEPETLFWLTEGDGERERWRWRRGQTQQPSLSVSQSVSQSRFWFLCHLSHTDWGPSVRGARWGRQPPRRSRRGLGGPQAPPAFSAQLPFPLFPGGGVGVEGQ